MRAIDYITTALKDLRRQFTRSLLTIVALMISTVVLVSILAISVGGRQALKEQFGADQALLQITVTPSQSGSTLNPYGTVQEVSRGSGKLNDKTTEELLKIPAVASASARAGIWELNHFSIEGHDNQFVAQAQGVPSDSAITLVAGARFENNDARNQVIIGENYARELGKPAGDIIGKTITITTQKGYRGEGAAILPTVASKQINEAFSGQSTVLTAKVIGIAGGADQNALLLPLGWARGIRTAQFSEASGVKKVDQLEADGYSAIRVQVTSPENVDSVSAAIKQLGYGQISTKEQLQRLEQFTTTMWALLGAVAFIAIFAAALGVANTMLMAAAEQQYVISVWRAVGASKQIIIRLFLMQATLLGLIGGILGTGAGILVSSYVNSYIASLLVSQGLAAVSIAVLPWWLLIGSVLITALFALLAGLYPAYKAAKADASAALRSN